MPSLTFRSGQIELRKFRVASDTIIEVGDLIYIDNSNQAKPASDFSWNTNLPTTQADFSAVFAGIAYSRSADGDTNPVSVNVSPNSVYEADATSATFEVGTPLAPAEGSSTLTTQQLETVADPLNAIARAAEYHEQSSSRVRFTIASAFHTASANINASLG